MRIKRYLWVGVSVAVMLGFAVLNVLAYRHAYAFHHFVAAGERTAPPEALTAAERLRVLFHGVRVPRPASANTPGQRGLPARDVTIPLTGGRGTLAAWWVAPHPDPRGVVLVFHGYSSTKGLMLAETAGFCELGFNCLVVDFRGSGGSTGSDTTFGVREAEDVAAAVQVARALSQPVPPVSDSAAPTPAPPPLILYGHSMGAAAVLRAVALGGVEADALIVEAVFDHMRNAVAARVSAMGLPPLCIPDLLLYWGGRQLGYSPRDHSPLQYASAVRVPCLVLVGAHDRRAPPAQARRVYEALAGPRQFAVIEEGEHVGLAASNSARWQFVIDDFLRSRVHPKAFRGPPTPGATSRCCSVFVTPEPAPSPVATDLRPTSDSRSGDPDVGRKELG